MSQPSTPAAFVRVVTPRFHEVDRAGIAFFGRVFEYCHVVYEDLLAAVMGRGGLDAAFDTLGVGTPVVHADADFKAPMRMGQPMEVRLSVEAVTRRTFTCAYTLTGVEDGRLRAVAHVVHAAVDLRRFKSTDLPIELIDGFRRHGALTSDQIGEEGGDGGA